MATSYNGWPASSNPDNIGIVPLSVAGRSFPGGVKKGDVKIVLTYLIAQVHLRVESLYFGDTDKDDWGYSYRANRNNPSQLSCHSSGTAVDVNAVEHPNGARNTFSSAQVATIRTILKECGGVVKWGGDFSRTKDEMHFEIAVPPSSTQLKAVAKRLQNPLCWPGYNYKRGSKGKHVERLQARLRVKVDGVFGPATELAVKRTQARLGMKQTGIVTLGLARLIG